MPKFKSREEYEKWKAGKGSATPAPTPASTPAQATAPASATTPVVGSPPKRSAIADTLRLNPCKHHPKEEARWKCLACASEFCRICVEDFTFQRTTVTCPACRDGVCEDLVEEYEAGLKQDKAHQEEEEGRFAILAGFAAATIVFLVVLVSVGGELSYVKDMVFLLFMLSAMWFGPLMHVDSETKKITILTCAVLLAMSYPVLPSGIVKYLVILFLTVVALFVIGKMTHVAMHIANWGGRKPE
jgi:hypothetical protein